MIRNIALLVGFTALLLLSCTDVHARKVTKGWTQNGMSSYYAKSFNGRKTASGERYQHYAFTAAHRTLPFGTRVKVTDKISGKSIVVKINDRGPYHGNRILDLSGAAASRLGVVEQGGCDIELKVLSLPNPKQTKENLQVRALKTHPDSIQKLISVGFNVTKM